MKKSIALALLFVFVMPFAASQAFAAKETAQTGIVDAGNKLCPVSGDPVSGTNFVVYQGKRYGLCCPGCDKIFLSDPAKYLAKTKEPKADQSGIVDVGNKMCVIMSDQPVSGTSFVVYKGKRYGLCHNGDDKIFMRDPDKYVAQFEAREKAAASSAKPAPAVSKSKQMEKDMDQGSL